MSVQWTLKIGRQGLTSGPFIQAGPAIWKPPFKSEPRMRTLSLP